MELVEHVRDGAGEIVRSVKRVIPERVNFTMSSKAPSVPDGMALVTLHTIFEVKSGHIVSGAIQNAPVEVSGLNSKDLQNLKTFGCTSIVMPIGDATKRKR